MKTKTTPKNATKTPATEVPIETPIPEPIPTKSTQGKKPKTTQSKKDAKVPANTETDQKDAKVPANSDPDQKKTAKPKAEKTKKTSALDAAAQILAASQEALTCKGLIEKMQAEGLWVSTNGKTPDATLNAALHREIKVKGEASRFAKADRGKFKLAPTAK